MGRKKELYPQGSFWLRNDQGANEKNEYPIYIRYNYDRKKAQGSTGILVKECDWNPTSQRIRNTHPQAGRLNAQLDKRKNEIDAKIIEYVSNNKLTIQVLRDIVEGTFKKETQKEDIDFIQYTMNYLDNQYRLNKLAFSTMKNQKNYMDIFKNFILKETGSETLPMKNLSEDIIDSYILYRMGERNNSNESINKTLAPIIKAAEKAAANDYIKSSLYSLLKEKYLGTKTKLSQEEGLDDKGVVKYLTDEQLNTFIKLYDKVKHDRTRDYMDMFLFSFHACGLRFSDLMTLRWDQIDWNKKEINKILFKGNVPHTIHLSDPAIKILKVWQNKNLNNRFVFNLLPPNFDLTDEKELDRQRKNRNTPLRVSLMEIGLKMKLPFNLTIHVARHTFSVMALNKRNVSLHVISKLLAHSSILVTEKVYAKFLPETLDREVKEKLSFDFLPKRF